MITSHVRVPDGPFQLVERRYRPAKGSIVRLYYINQWVHGNVVRQHMRRFWRLVRRLRSRRRRAPRMRTLISRPIHIRRRSQKSFSGLGTSKQFGYTFFIKPRDGGRGHWRSVIHRTNGSNHVRRPAVWLFPRDNRLHVRVGTRRSWNDGCNTAYRLPVNRYSHVAVTTGRGYLRVYVNGVLRCSRSMSTYQILPPVGRLYVPDRFYHNPSFDIAGLRYYNFYIHNGYVRRDIRVFGRLIATRRRNHNVGYMYVHAVYATNGRNLAGAYITARHGRRTIRHRLNGHGRLRVRVNVGLWRVTVHKRGFVNYSFTMRVRRGGTTFARTPLSNSLSRGKVRFVLTWGSRPRDLDSWLRTPGGCLVKYNRRRCTTHGGLAQLDKDDTNGHGPETVTIHRRARSGTYTYIVHQYSGDGNMPRSPAVVRVYSGRRVYVFRAGRHGSFRGRHWCVARVDARTGRVTQCTNRGRRSRQLWKRLKVRFNNRCVTAIGNRRNNGVHAVTDHCHRGWRSQYMRLVNGRIVNLWGKCLDVYAYRRNNGAQVVWWQCTNRNNANQKWYLDRQGRIRSRLNHKCLDASIGSGHRHRQRRNVKLVMWNCHGGSWQKFRFMNR